MKPCVVLADPPLEFAIATMGISGLIPLACLGGLEPKDGSTPLSPTTSPPAGTAGRFPAPARGSPARYGAGVPASAASRAPTPRQHAERSRPAPVAPEPRRDFRVGRIRLDRPGREGARCRPACPSTGARGRVGRSPMRSAVWWLAHHALLFGVPIAGRIALTTASAISSCTANTLSSARS